MAEPSPTPRGDPHVNDIPLQDGHSTKVTLGLNDDIAIFEKTVTPPGYDGGDPVDLTTMFNVQYRTFAPRQLKTLTEITMTGTYDPILYTEMLAAINREDTITVTFSDGSTLAFYGYVRSFTPNEHVEGGTPEATVVIQPTNWDADNDVEEGPIVDEIEGS